MTNWKIRPNDPAYPNESFVDMPGGYIEIGGARKGREDAARLIEAAPEQNALLVEALDLVPRISDDDPMAPALAEWCKRVRIIIAKAKG
jgi:hypothetical protein